jgi:hypothetical protein
MIILNMKKTFLFLALASIAITSCRKDDTEEVIPEVSIETQNSYDDEAAQKFLETHAFDSKGNLKNYVETDATQVKLTDLNPIKLPSGVIYVVRPGAQPSPGNDIGSTDVLRLMSTSITYIATNTDSKTAYTSPFVFKNTIAGSGIPELDPSYYSVKQSVLDNATADLAKQRSFYEIEGFKEALQKFKAFNISDESNYNLQGVIIVPSRAAFARDDHFNYSNISFKDRSFVFSFQVYKATQR